MKRLSLSIKPFCCFEAYMFCLGGLKDLLSAAVENFFFLIKIDKINKYVRATVRKGEITVILELPLKVFDGKNSESSVR